MQVCTSLQADNHASTPPLSFLQAGCPSCRPTNSVKALKALHYSAKDVKMETSFSIKLCNYNNCKQLKLKKCTPYELHADKYHCRNSK